jgi:RNA polymerase sigma-70 factor (ECF subfamily)
VHDESVAEDLLQELFIRIWNRGKDYDAARGALGVWVISIARNMAIDYIRSAHAKFQTRIRPIQDVSPISLSVQHSQPESVIDRARAVSNAFEHLKPNEKRVVELAYFEGCSQTEIAARLQEPLGTVKSWMRSAMSRLRAATKMGAAQ